VGAARAAEGGGEVEVTGVELAIGSTVWIFDPDRRVYSDKKLAKGQLWYSGAPIWREHWRPCVIMGETRVSWLVGHTKDDTYPRKISKRDLAAGTVRGVLTSEADLDAACYVQEHVYKIAERVQRISGGLAAAETLRKIAALVGYEESKS
jgi:hypothetical protein